MVIKYLTIFLLSTSFKFNQPKKGAKISLYLTPLLNLGPFKQKHNHAIQEQRQAIQELSIKSSKIIK